MFSILSHDLLFVIVIIGAVISNLLFSFLRYEVQGCNTVKFGEPGERGSQWIE